MSETFECPKCGYQWQQGQHGGHSCSDRLLQQLKDVMTERNSILADWNAIVSASGSKTHGGAVGHVAQMRAELEAVKAERDELKKYSPPSRDDIIQALIATSKQSEGITADSILGLFESCGESIKLENDRLKEALASVGGMYRIRTELNQNQSQIIAGIISERDALRARIEAAEKREPFACYVGEGFIKYPAMNIASIKKAAEKFGYEFTELYTLPQMPAHPLKLPQEMVVPGYNGDGDTDYATGYNAALYEVERLNTSYPMPAQQYNFPSEWREDVFLAAQMLTWGRDECLTEQQDKHILAHQNKLFSMLDEQSIDIESGSGE